MNEEIKGETSQERDEYLKIAHEARETRDVAVLGKLAEINRKGVLYAIVDNSATTLPVLRVVLDTITKQEKGTPRNIANIHPRSRAYVARTLASHKKITANELGILVKFFHTDEATMHRVLKHEKLDEVTYRKIVDYSLNSFPGIPKLLQKAIEHRYVTLDVLDDIRTSAPNLAKITAGRHHLYTVEDCNRILDFQLKSDMEGSFNDFFLVGLVGNRNVKGKNLTKAVHAVNWLMRYGAITNPNLTSKQKNVLRNDSHEWVQYAANILLTGEECEGMPFEWLEELNPAPRPEMNGREYALSIFTEKIRREVIYSDMLSFNIFRENWEVEE